MGRPQTDSLYYTPKAKPMIVYLVPIIISFLGGMLAYLLYRWWYRPVVTYRRLRGRILKALDPTAPSKELRQLAMELQTLFNEKLPPWYRIKITQGGQDPLAAVKELMKLGNAKQKSNSQRSVAKIESALGQTADQ